MKKKYKFPLIIVVILILIIAILIAFKVLNGKSSDTRVKVVDSIDNYSYTLDERDTNLMKTTYNELKKILNEKDVNYEEYAKTLSKLFVIDLFTISNKINKYDVASTEYIYPDNIDNFKTNVEDTLYKNVEYDNGKRKQVLPTVKSIISCECNEDTFLLNEESVDSYAVTIKWDYEKDLGYDDTATITLVKKDNKLYVVEYKPGEDHE